MRSEIDLDNERYYERIRFLDLEISRLQSKIADYNDELRWKNMEKQRLLDSIIESKR